MLTEVILQSTVQMAIIVAQIAGTAESCLGVLMAMGANILSAGALSE